MRKRFVLLVCIRMLVVCIRMLLVCYSYVSHVARMYSYVSVCSVRYSYVTRMYSCSVLVMISLPDLCNFFISSSSERSEIPFVRNELIPV